MQLGRHFHEGTSFVKLDSAVKYIYAGGLTAIKTSIRNAGTTATTVANRGWRVAVRANLRNAIEGSVESLNFAEQYFNRIRSNPLDYPPSMHVGSLSKEDWITQKFLATGNFEGHHVILKQALESQSLRDILDWAENNGKLGEFDFGTEKNGIMLAKRKRNIDGDVVGDHANHPEYNRQIIKLLNDTKIFPPNNPALGFEKLKSFAQKLKSDLEINVINGNNIVNDLTIIFP